MTVLEMKGLSFSGRTHGLLADGSMFNPRLKGFGGGRGDDERIYLSCDSGGLLLDVPLM